MIQFYFWTIEQSEIAWATGYFVLSWCGGLLGWAFKAGHKSSPLARAKYAALTYSTLFIITCTQAFFVLGAHALAYGALPVLFSVAFGAVIFRGYLHYAFSRRRGADISRKNLSTAVAFIPLGNLIFLFSAGDAYRASQTQIKPIGSTASTTALVAWAFLMYGSAKTVERQIEFIEPPEMSSAQSVKYFENVLDDLGFEAFYRYLAGPDIASLPSQLDQGLWLADIQIEGPKITYIHEVKAGFSLTQAALDQAFEWVCTNDAFIAPLARDGVIVHTYFETGGALILEFLVQESDCVVTI